MMKTLRLILAALMLACHASLLFGQGTAFTYQGRLLEGVNPANGSYDLRFMVYDDSANGNRQGPILTNATTAVSNGLFSATLDFGNQFPGANRWLEIAVCTNGGGSFITLSPRQSLTPAPYAITAGNVIPGGIPSGTYTNVVVFNNANNQFAGNGGGLTNIPASGVTGTLSPTNLPANVVTNNQTGVMLAGTFSGNGAGLTNLTGVPNMGTNSVAFAAQYKVLGFDSARFPNGLIMYAGFNPTNTAPVNNRQPIYYEPKYTLRDPSHIKYGNQYLLAYNNETSVGVSVATSPDDYHWTFYGYMPLGTNFTSQWSPKWFTDATNGLHIILAVSTNINQSTLFTYLADVNPANPTNFSNLRQLILTNDASTASAAQVLYWNGLYYLFNNGNIYTSPDLSTNKWHNIGIGVLTGGEGPQITWFNGLFYATATENMSSPWQFSSDLTNWTAEVDFTNNTGLEEGTAIVENCATVQPFPTVPSGILTNNQAGVTLGGSFTGNGSGLTNLDATKLTGTLPAANLPGITTNVSTAGITFYITNGLIMRVSTP